MDKFMYTNINKSDLRIIKVVSNILSVNNNLKTKNHCLDDNIIQHLPYYFDCYFFESDNYLLEYKSFNKTLSLKDREEKIYALAYISPKSKNRFYLFIESFFNVNVNVNLTKAARSLTVYDVYDIKKRI